MGLPAEASEEKPGLIKGFAVLSTAPRELWIIYFAKVMETTAYALVNYALMFHLINDLGFSDGGAGTFVGVFAALFSLCTFLVGGLTDAIGIRKTLLIALVVCLVTRLLAAVLGSPTLTPPLAFVPMAFGAAMALPVMVAAARRYTNTKQHSIGFALLYVFMNLGLLIAGKMVDEIRQWIGKNDTWSLLGLELSVYQVIFLLSTAFTLLALLPVFAMRRGVDMTDESDEPIIAAEKVAEAAGTLFGAIAAAFRKTVRIFGEVFRERAFYRFLLFLTVVVGVRIVFHHMHYTLGPWCDRELGYGSRFGTAWGVVNPFLIIVLTPLVGVLAAKISSYRMIIVGTTISAAACFFLALPGDLFASQVPTDLGGAAKWLLDLDGDLAPLYFNLLYFAVLFSVGEAIWSPRLYQYTATVAPKGREATYMGLSLLPLFLGKHTAGPLGGYLLGRYTPAEGERSGGTLWLVVAIMAVATPVCILLFKRVIQPKESDSAQPEAKEAQA